MPTCQRHEDLSGRPCGPSSQRRRPAAPVPAEQGHRSVDPRSAQPAHLADLLPQHGAVERRPFDLSVFEQGSYWITPDQVRVPLRKMSREVLRGVVDFLSCHASHFYVQMLRRAVLKCVLVGESGDLHAKGDAACDLRLLLEMAPDAWLESTPLVRSLRRRVAEAES